MSTIHTIIKAKHYRKPQNLLVMKKGLGDKTLQVSGWLVL